jgi:transcriptional regulator with XRE-family HTH domain
MNPVIQVKRRKSMSIGSRIRQLRGERGMSQGDIERRTGLLRCYISRVENGHTVPSLETLERFASALDLPLYRLFYNGPVPEPKPDGKVAIESPASPGESGPEASFLLKLREFTSRIPVSDREVLLTLATRLAARPARAGNGQPDAQATDRH